MEDYSTRNNYSCDKCVNRRSKRKCQRCVHEADKRPSKFRLDKSVQSVCPALSVDGQDCSVILSIRDWKRKIREIDEEIRRRDRDSTVDAQPIIDFIDATRMLQGKRLHCLEDHLLVENVLSHAFTYVSCDKLIVSLDSIRGRENARIELIREKDNLQKKIDDAMKGLGI